MSVRHEPASIVATPATRNLAKQILLDSQWDGADAVLRHLPDVRPSQVPALVALLAKAALTGTIPAPTGAPRKPLLLTPDERKRAHARYVAGVRDAATVRGEREYQRAWTRERRTVA